MNGLALWTALSSVTASDLVGLTDLGPAVVSGDGRAIAVETRRADLATNQIGIRWLILTESAGKVQVSDVGEGGDPIIEVYRGQITGFSVPQEPQWSPDSEWIAYRRRSQGSVQLWRSRRDGGQQEQLTHAPQDVESFCWSAEGSRILYSYSTARVDFEQALKEEGTSGYLYDERFSPYHSRAPLFDPTPELPRAYRAAEVGQGTEHSATANEVRELTKCQAARAGRSRALLEDRRSNPEIGVNPPLSVAGCSVPECTGHFKGVWKSAERRNVFFLRWSGAKQYGSLSLFRWRPGDFAAKEILRTEDLLEDCSLLHAERLLCAHESATTPRKLVTIDLATGRHQTLFDPNPGFRNLKFGRVASQTWKDSNGIEGFGHLVLPVGDPRQRAPLIIVQYRSRGFLRGGVGDEYPIHLFAAHGFAVLSFERPEDPDLEATVRSYDELETRNGADLRERRRVLSVLLAGIDHLDQQGLIDPTRVGLTGLSDGGETVGFALATESRRFAAAAASWIALSPTFYYVIGPKFQAQFERWGFGFPHGPAATQWQRGSLALNAANVQTPLLLQVSDQELLPESETVAALKYYAKPVELYVFATEHHVKVQPRHRHAIYRRNLQWFQYWLQGVEAADPLDPGQYERWRALKALSQTSAATQASRPNN